MIVIISHNGIDCLPRLIKSIEQYGPLDEEYLIVDTQSNESEFLKYLDSLINYDMFNLKVVQSPYNGYELGTITWVAKNYKREDYIFLQDAMEVKESNWLNKFREGMPDKIGLVAWQLYDYFAYNDKTTADWVLNNIGVNDFKGKGVFGAILYTNRETFNILESKGFLNIIPTNKHEAIAGELALSAMCHAAEIPMVGLYIHDWDLMNNKKMPLFNKYILQRGCIGWNDNDNPIYREK